MKQELIFEDLITVTQPSLPDFNSYIEHIKGIWDRKWLTNNGPLHEEFKEKLSSYLRTPNVELFTNGHLALETAIKSLNLTGEVITTPFTFASTIHAITNCNLKPIFCDVDPVTYNIDINKIESLITSETSAILAVHVFGQPCDVEGIERIAEAHNLKVIYDAAHAFGVKVKGTDIANFGDISMFSFHATKVFHSIEGGMLSYQDESLSTKLRALKNFGMTSAEKVEYVGSNAKMNEFQAAMGLCNLEKINQDISLRKEVFYTYHEWLNKIDSIQLFNFENSITPNFSYYPILMDDYEQRNRLVMRLKEYNVVARKYFYPLCSQFDCYDFSIESTPIAADISDRVLCLPMYSELSVENAKQICEIIRYELGDEIVSRY